MPAWLKQILELVRGALPREFFGSIEINVYAGGIRNIVVTQSYKDTESRPDKESDLARGRG